MKRVQTNYKHRAQLACRKHLGELEKKKDIQRRLKEKNTREKNIQILLRKIEEKNPEEFNHCIYKYKRDGLKLFKESVPEPTTERKGKETKKESETQRTERTQKRTVFID
ncbi:hypothetical protein NEOKW01_0814 [Nematocida sp. AWRm80]|nr:hypothetical protein NEOKW01_0814 [Nematocida sp. AWRm80]